MMTDDNESLAREKRYNTTRFGAGCAHRERQRPKDWRIYKRDRFALECSARLASLTVRHTSWLDKRTFTFKEHVLMRRRCFGAERERVSELWWMNICCIWALRTHGYDVDDRSAVTDSAPHVQHWLRAAVSAYTGILSLCATNGSHVLSISLSQYCVVVGNQNLLLTVNGLIETRVA